MIDWTSFKSLITSKNLYLQYTEDSYYYYLQAIDGQLTFKCNIDKNPSDSTDLDDFVNNFKSLSTTNLPLTQLDTDGAQIVRNKAAKKGWTYAAVPIELSTSSLSTSIYSKLVDGTDRAGITLKAYDSNDAEVTTAGTDNVNLATIVKTVLDLEFPYNFEIIGGILRTETSIDSDMRLWIIAVPDISAAYGGSKEMCGGLNLKYLAPNNEFAVDGRVTKYMTYNATYHTNKIRFIFLYPAGTTERLLVTMEIYRQ